jgi:hypothetical protein
VEPHSGCGYAAIVISDDVDFAEEEGVFDPDSGYPGPHGGLLPQGVSAR